MSIRPNETEVDKGRQEWAPSSPHHPHDRVCLHEEGGWELTIFARNDPRHADLACRGMLHMQLWHPELELSVLTPSQLSGGVYSVSAPGLRKRICCYDHLTDFLSANFGVAPLCFHKLAHFETWFIRAAEIGVVQRAQ